MLTLIDIDAEFNRIVDELTRRRFLAGVAGSAALVGLTACGTTSNASSLTSSGASRKVSTIHGDVDVPNAPIRIVATDFPEACALLDLGITPVGRPSYIPKLAAYTTALKNVPTIDDDSGSLVIETIAAAHPDLIVGDDWADPTKQRMPFDKLRQIAPTTLFAWEQAAGNWPTLAAETAAAIGRTPALQALESKYTSRAGSVKAANAALFARTRWDIIDCSQDSWDLYSANSSHGHVLTTAGVSLNAAQHQTDGYVQYSLERFDLLTTTDVIVTTTDSLPYLHAQKAFMSLPAAKAGRLYATDLFFPASYGIALALLDDLAGICSKVAGA